MKSLNDIRAGFLDFFRDQGHQAVASSQLAWSDSVGSAPGR